jgi:hypothetical protein
MQKGKAERGDVKATEINFSLMVQLKIKKSKKLEVRD